MHISSVVSLFIAYVSAAAIQNTTIDSAEPDHSSSIAEETLYNTTSATEIEYAATTTVESEHTTSTVAEPEYTTTVATELEYNSTVADNTEYNATVADETEYNTTITEESEYNATVANETEYNVTKSDEPEYNSTSEAESNFLTTFVTETELNQAPSAERSLLIDAFYDTSLNALGFYHGASGGAGIKDFEDTNGGEYLKVTTGDVDASFVTGLAEGCTDFTAHKDDYVHIKYSGSSKFSVSLQQHNKDCDDAKLPFPETFDSVQASRYTTEDKRDIYIPLSHFRVNFERINGIALENWYTNDSTYVNKIEIVSPDAVPKTMEPVKELETGKLHVGCKNPNHIAFGIDDGSPKYLQETLQIVKEEQIPVTFFVQGSALQLPVEDGNFTNAYREMIDRGHQIGLHTMSHPRMEGVKTEEEIDRQITQNIDIVKDKLNVDTKYFRPPYGTVGSRTRQALARHITDPQLIMWSIDIKDWVYGEHSEGDPQRMQYKAFQESLDKGGSIVVLHYLYRSTVDQFRDMIKLAKNKGRQFVRVDQCVGDPDAPQTWGWTR